MELLRDRFGETVNLAVLDRRHIVYVHQVESERAVRAFNRTGNRVLAHASAAGKALLAWQPEATIATLLDGGLAQLTPATITAPERFAEYLAEVRRRGYALDLGEQDEDVVCVAAPIGSPGGRPLAALSLSGPASRMRRAQLGDTGTEVARAAAAVFGPDASISHP
jgi:IclR family acetate operon transcriptional repressor